ncbi:hypothetical protein OEZ86_013687 [Tetradesmus obliquus]|nr:hypothetical protein OEZ86_013687 [Tetradesmus obliquus]
MLDWFLLSFGGAAVYAASKWFKARAAASKSSKQQPQQRTGKYGQPLRLVVAQCEARWFLQELQLAMSGDAEAMVRVSHMLMAGYGTQQDHTAAARWMRQAW